MPTYAAIACTDHLVKDAPKLDALLVEARQFRHRSVRRGARQG